MTVRPDVAELLHAGYGDRTIARQLGVSIGSVTRARTLLRLPKARRGHKPAATVEDMYWRRAQPLDDGHYQWTGHITNKGTPVVHFGGRSDRKVHTAYRIAYRIRHGTDPLGHVHPTCGRPGCVAPDHLTDSATAPRTVHQRGKVGRPAGGSREDIERLLRAGGSNKGIARQLHTDTRRVAKIRAELGLDPIRTLSFAEKWAAATEPTADGHVRWTGRLRDGVTPSLVHHGRDYSARRAGFEELHGRDAVGMVLPGCGRDDCVRPEHLEDRPMREQLATQFTAIFGAAS